PEPAEPPAETAPEAARLLVVGQRPYEVGDRTGRHVREQGIHRVVVRPDNTLRHRIAKIDRAAIDLCLTPSLEPVSVEPPPLHEQGHLRKAVRIAEVQDVAAA